MKTIVTTLFLGLGIKAALAQVPSGPPIAGPPFVEPSFNATPTTTSPYQINGVAAMTYSVMTNSTQTPASGGTGNTAGDNLTLNDGCSSHAIFTVLTAPGGSVATWKIKPGNAGICLTPPKNPVTVLSSSGSGQQTTFNLTWGPTPGGQDLTGAISVAGGIATANNPFTIGPTTFTASGCSNNTLLGSGAAGSFKSGTSGTCTVTITINGATGMTATNGWACFFNDQTTPADVIHQTAYTTTTVTMSGTTVSGDLISFACRPF
jgi:hypothetical protein